MPRESVDAASLAKRAYDLFNRRDLDGFLKLMDAEIESESRLAPLEGGYHGHEGIRRWWTDLFEVFPDMTNEVIEVRSVGDISIASLRNTGHGSATGTPLEETFWMVGRWRGGKCVWWASFLTQAEALEAVGLSEAAWAEA